MSDQDAFERILASLYDAMLDDALWPATSALIDEACGMQGNALLVGEGPKDDVRALFLGLYYRGERREDWEREYLDIYHPIDESVQRFRQLPDSRLVHTHDLYTAEELKTSPAYQEGLRRFSGQDGLRARLDGPDSSHYAWGHRRPGYPMRRLGSAAGRAAQRSVRVPHIRQFVRVRQALKTSLTYNELLRKSASLARP